VTDPDPANANAKANAKARKPRAANSAARRWLIRAAVALAVGLGIGMGAGMFAVDTLEPGRPNSVDSLQVMLDSIARGTAPAPQATAPLAPAPAANPDPVSPPDERVEVPALVDLEEGAARNAILDAELQVGEIRFQASEKPAGTVLASDPAAGTRVPRTSAITLVLSDGRPPAR
jgi:hypothetical protein